ncbi:MAG: LacI family DNA-binding transcriptional regulator [Chloroflexota bacterium]
MPRQHRVTIREIARMCGVSMQTVSRVINNRPDVSPATRQSIEAAIAATGFQPSAVARSLVQRRSQTLGVIATRLELFGVAQTLNGITAASQGADYALLLKELANDDVGGVPAAIDFLVAHRVEGLIIFNPPNVETSVSVLQAKVPASRPPIVVLKSEPSSVFSTISVDNFGGARMATEHLLALGCSRIGHIAGPPSWREARDRTDGWRTALADAGIEPGPIASGNWSSASGETAARELLARAPDLDGIFVANDQMALGLFHVAHERGIAIPEQIAVVGFDGLDEGAQFTPSLTTIGQPLRELGKLAVRELLSTIDAEPGHSEVHDLTLATELIVRDSAPMADPEYAERVSTG